MTMLICMVCPLLLSAMSNQQSDWLSSAEHLCEQGRHQTAIAYTDSLLKTIDDLTAEEQARFYLIRGTALRYNGQKIPAIQAWQNTIAIANKDLPKANAHYQLGELYFEEKSFSQALKHYQSALRIFADEGQSKDANKTRYKAGIVQRKLENYSSAISLFEGVIQSDDVDLMRNALCHDQLGQIFFDQADFEKSLEHFEASNLQYRAFDFSSSLVENLRMMALIHKMENRHAAAIECLTEAVEVSQKSGDVRGSVKSLLELAQEHRANNDLLNAIRTHKKAMKITPKEEVRSVAEEWLNLATMLGETDQDMEAELTFYTAYSYAQDNDLKDLMEETSRLQSAWFEKQGNTDKAFRALKKADSLSMLNSYATISKLKREVNEKKLNSETYLRHAEDARTQM
ncbi:MAG: tetratricopeptide repeat protein, partial [Bacteroidota bacterium]